jgi:hypothetical protein
LMPIVGLSKAPSGLAVTQPMVKLYVTVAAAVICRKANAQARATTNLEGEFIVDFTNKQKDVLGPIT